MRTAILTPSKALLNPPSKPNCAADSSAPTTASSGAVAAKPAAQGDASGEQQGVLAAKAIVEFERDFYRNVEKKTRQRLEKLQKAVRITKRAIKRLSAN